MELCSSPQYRYRIIYDDGMDHIDDLEQERFRLIKGTKISIYIEDDNYECTIIAHDPNKRGSRSQFVYTIQYVGSDETETLDLSKHDFKIIGMPPESQRKSLVISKVHKQKKFLLVDSSTISVGDTNLVAGASTKKLVSKQIHTTRKKVFPTDKPDRHANKVVDVVEIVLNSKVPLSTLRESPRDAIKEIVRKEADITYGNSYWTNIKSLLHMAIAAKEKGEKVDHTWLVRMHRDYAPSDLIDGRLVPRDPAAAATASPAATLAPAPAAVPVLLLRLLLQMVVLLLLLLLLLLARRFGLRQLCPWGGDGVESGGVQ